MNNSSVGEFVDFARKKLKKDSIVADWIAADLLNLSTSELPLFYQKPFLQIATANQWLEDFLNGKPYQYISHRAYFFDLCFYVDENVLIPRPETEELVEWVLNSHQEERLKVLDLGTGSGEIAITLKHYRPNWQVVGSDIFDPVIEIAKKNAEMNHCDVEFVKSDVFENITDQYDLIVSNPPYIGKKEKELMDKSVLNYEPHSALFADNDGYYFYQKIYEEVPQYLTPSGELFMEFGFQQKKRLKEIFEKGPIIFKRDLNGHDRLLRWKIDAGL